MKIVKIKRLHSSGRRIAKRDAEFSIFIYSSSKAAAIRNPFNLFLGKGLGGGSRPGTRPRGVVGGRERRRAVSTMPELPGSRISCDSSFLPRDVPSAPRQSSLVSTV
jgi:hypothetical protein